MRLDPDDIEAIAQRVAELLDHRPAPEQPARYLSAGQLAEVLGVERDWVYAHARRLGAIRLGGPHGRLRFDLHHVERVLAADPPRDRATARPGTGRHRSASPGRVELIPYAS